MPLYLSENEVKQLPLSIEAAIPIMEETLRDSAAGLVENGQRTRMPVRGGFMQFGPAVLHAKGVAGFKLWANFGRGTGVHKGAPGCDYLYSLETGELLAIIHAYLIGKYRTSAVSAVAAKYLSPPGASALGLYSSGRIAEGQLEAICKVRPIKRVRVYSPTPKNREAFCARMSEKLGIEVLPVPSPELVPQDADIVVTASTAEQPILFGDWLKRPGLVIAAGANHWYKREIDGKVVERAQLVVVDLKEHAKTESGNLLWAVDHGILSWDRVEEIGQVIRGRVPLPDFGKATILFGSHGLNTTDVAMAARAYELAKERGLGKQLDF